MTELPEHSLTEVELLQNAQFTSASIERFFSILKQLLRPGRKFKEENVFSYLIISINCVFLH